MIIKNLEIISFGKFSDKTLEFSDGFNVIFGNNESGKSTIINFIYAMFYGFGDNRGKTLSLREKYTPWSGGACEGKITVLTDDGKNICIYRKAGNVKKYDILRVYDADTGEEYSISPEEIIGVSADTFFKTLCIRQLTTAFEGNNDEITQKLSNIASSGDETISYDKAQKILDGIRREIKPQRGTGGELASITNKIAQIEKEKHTQNRVKSELRSVTALYTQTEKEVSLIQKKADAIKEKDYTAKIAHLQGRLEEKQNHLNSKGNTSLFSVGILCLLAGVIALFISVYYSLFLIPVSIVFLLLGFIKKNPAENTDIKDIEKQLQQLISEKEAHDKEIKMLSISLSEAEKKLESLKIRKEYLSVSLSDNDVSTESLLETKKKLEKNLHTVSVSMKALKRAHENIQKNFTPALNKKAAEYFYNISGGKYTRIFCDRDFGVMIETDLPRESGFFSGGTVDQLYLSVRLALIDMIYGDLSCSVILDQPFLQYDKPRKEKAVRILENLPANRQIILFTSDESVNSANKATQILT